MPTIKNIIIFASIATVIILGYVFFLRTPAEDTATLVSSLPTPVVTPGSAIPNANPASAGDFLALFLSVKNIKLNDAILSDPAFTSLHDSSITLTPDGTEGRPNPFAPLGSDNVAPSGNPPSGTPSTVPTTGTPPPKATN